MPDDAVLVAVVAALAAGACFALAGVLQQRAAARCPTDESLTFRLLLELARQPMWLVGIAIALLAYGFQSLALAFGPLSLVQPLIVCELVFAIPLSARILRMRLRAREWTGTLAVLGGLVIALLAARPQPGSPTASVAGWLLTLLAAGVVTVAALVGSRYLTGPARASLLALAAGTVMGSQSVLLDATTSIVDEGVAAVLTAWQTYLLVAASIGGLLLIQSAFQAGPLAASMPVMDATEPAVAIAVGVGLFGEQVRVGWPEGPAVAVGLALLLAGIVLLDTSPLLRAVYARERENGDADSGGGGDGDGDGARQG